MLNPKVLVVDDEPGILDLICEYFKDHPFDITRCHGGATALEWLEQSACDAILTDLCMSPVDGLEILHQAKEKYPQCEVILMTGYASLDSSLAALRGKVFDYLEKPLDLERLERSLQNALRKNALAAENTRLVEELSRQNEQLERQVEEATRELQERTIKDYLTGLNNYRFFVNAVDALGHLAGNQVLKTISHIVRSVVRENDMVARYGGEEFGIILPETSKQEAIPIIKRIQKSIRDRHFSYILPRGERTILTISAGIAACPEDADHYDALVQKADEALYQAKTAGRDQLVLARSPESPESTNEEN